MSEPPRDRSTGEPPDLIGIALGSIATGATTGAAAVTAGLLLLRGRLAAGLPPILFAGIVVGAGTAWLVARPLAGDPWRRGVTAALAVFAGLLLAFLSAPADRAGGRAGLLTYGLLLAAAGLGAARYTRNRSRT